MTDVCVVGQGHIGLPTALTIAKSGLQVVGVDITAQLVEDLNKGINHLIEPGLSELLISCIDTNTYSASLTPETADTYIVSVPTPLDSDNQPVLDHVVAAAESIGPHIRRGNLVILESTVPPGTTRGAFTKALTNNSELTPEKDFFVAHCPERVLPGTILRELVENDRVVGGSSAHSSAAAAKFYRYFVTGDVIETDALTAELVKLSENIYRDVNIGLANELAIISEDLGANVWDVIELANKHPRVNIHQPGPGVGGYCIPVAPWMLSANLDELPPTIHQARRINAEQPARTVQQVLGLLEGTNSPKVAVLGAAYKGGVGDARATPTVEIVDLLIAAGATVAVHDPLTTNFKYPLESYEDTVRHADLAIILTAHTQFESLDPVTTAKLMKFPVIVDTRNSLPVTDWEQAGFKVVRLGVGTSK
ncbi:MAG: nucleotide sugar dehydrogenase [Chloroflexi bacterium]|nr:nucleotide sugar dehydrogenase [Chloroflexota bacterium]